MGRLPKWADYALIPLLNVLLAFFVSGLVVMFIGEDPIKAMMIMLKGSLGSPRAIGYTLYYATNFIFTGLAVAVAFHARLFNIGGEGQAGVAGLGVAFVSMYIDWPNWELALPAAMVGAMVFAGIWAAIPAYLQSKRGSHIVITTIMFNYIASALLVYMLVNVIKDPASMAPQSRGFVPGAVLPTAKDMLGWVGISFPRSPVNISFLLAVAACFGVWILIWKSKLGYEIRAFGHSESAAVYAGISPFKITMISMTISGSLAGLMAINTVMGEGKRLVLDPVEGAGFIGIAVALIGRSHPVGVFLAAILFGMLYQGGFDLSFDMPAVSREMILVIQALVILFTGALENLIRVPITRLFVRFSSGAA